MSWSRDSLDTSQNEDEMCRSTGKACPTVFVHKIDPPETESGDGCAALRDHGRVHECTGGRPGRVLEVSEHKTRSLFPALLTVAVVHRVSQHERRALRRVRVPTT